MSSTSSPKSSGHDSDRALAAVDGRRSVAWDFLSEYLADPSKLQRFYILNWTNVVATLLRTALIVVVLNRDTGC